MSRDFDDIYKKIDQSHKDLHKKENEASKSLDSIENNQIKMMREISEIKKEITEMAVKVDAILEILNNFTIMLAEEEECDDEDYDSDETWVPKDDEFWDENEDNDL